MTQYRSLFPSLFLFTFMLLLLTENQGYAQRRGVIDDFENGTLEFRWRRQQGSRPAHLLWRTVTPVTYGLSEENGVLKVDYSRKAGMGAYDRFSYVPFRAIDVERNPRIQLQVRSGVDTKLTVSPVYSMEPPTLEYLEAEIPGDGSWHTCTFDLTPSYFRDYGSVESVDFYFDRDTSIENTGTIEIDNFKLAWYIIEISKIKTSVRDGQKIELSWNSSDASQTGKYMIYRGTKPGFEPGEANFLAESIETVFIDEDLEPYMHYYYKIVPVHNGGEVYFESEEVKGETYIPGQLPLVRIAGTNAREVKKYEKFEARLDLDKVGIANPYDPEDIDVWAIFRAPSGKEIRINAFFDDFEGAGQWKLRFSPNETGAYSYQVHVKDAGGEGQAAVEHFTAIESEHQGWIRPSKVNPHYFAHDDGSSYYGVGVYSPWRNNAERFETFARHDANLFALWDITYGGFVNGTGLIEEELGRYNQLKCGRIDSMLSIFEESGIKLMYAIWPHDLFSETVWAAQWKQNPYSSLIDVEDVYSDSLVWEYQKKKYRYMIARFAHSRSFGIWELINEMNGTDGWAHGRHRECYDWVEKCQQYFRENDPYGHPVTASFSGGFEEYREELYERTDIPNIHVYPAQGWKMKYPADTMRSAMHNYAWASRRFWDRFDKPAIFGEAGASLAYYPVRDENYHISYHNQIWASLVNGLAATPVWWDYPVLTEGDWEQLQHLSRFVSDIDFANRPYQPLAITAEGTDLYVMGTPSDAFGWGRSYEKQDISGAVFTINGLEDGSYRLSWTDPWSGKVLRTEKVKSKNGELSLAVPTLPDPHPDVAFRLLK